MATFHRMKDDAGEEVVRCFVKGAPDQLLARAWSHLDPELAAAVVDEDFKAAIWPRTSGWRRRAYA